MPPDPPTGNGPSAIHKNIPTETVVPPHFKIRSYGPVPSSSKVSLTCNLLTAGLFTKFLLCLYTKYLCPFEFACMLCRLATPHLSPSNREKYILSIMATISIKVQGRRKYCTWDGHFTLARAQVKRSKLA